MKTIVRVALVLGAALLLNGCGGGPDPRTAELLSLSYSAMGDAELQVYHQQLGDQLARAARSAREGQGRGLLEAKRAGDEAADEEALRERWNAVRQELRRRELLP